MRKICSIDREKHLKLEAEGREFAKFLRSLGQFIQAVKVQNIFLVIECFFNLFPGGFSYLICKSEQLEFKLEKIIGI